MGWMGRVSVFMGAVPFLLLALVGARGTSAQDVDPGERIMNASCQTCHDVRRIQTSALDAEQWTERVNTMIGKGAKVESADLPVLIEYLARQHGPVPDGAGKRILLNICTMCHDLNRIKHGRRSPEEWEETLNTMLNEGAPLSDAAFPVIHEYLSENFGVD
jgi:cytochrome c5